MSSSLRNTWLAIALATFAVASAGFFIVRTFVRDVFVDCQGTLEPRSPRSITDPDLETVSSYKENLFIRYDEVARKPRPWNPTRYKNVRVVWERPSVSCSCTDAEVSQNTFSQPWSAQLYRDKTTGLYVVTPDSSGAARHTWLAVFARVDNTGHRFQLARALSPKHVPMLVFFLALGALTVAAFRASRGTPYATRIHTWQTATLRPDGLVESETGAAIGTASARTRIRAGTVLVDPAALEGRDIYRAMPILDRRQVAPGRHDEWSKLTMRRFRDACALAILSTLTTALAVVGHVLGA